MTFLLNSVCDAVDEVMAGRYRIVDRDAVCDASVYRPQYQTAIARHILIYALHDMCGWSYSGIVRKTGIGIRNVMRAVAKVRVLRFSDADYAEILKRVTERLYYERAY